MKKLSAKRTGKGKEMQVSLVEKSLDGVSVSEYKNGSKKQGREWGEICLSGEEAWCKSMERRSKIKGKMVK